MIYTTCWTRGFHKGPMGRLNGILDGGPARNEVEWLTSVWRIVGKDQVHGRNLLKVAAAAACAHACQLSHMLARRLRLTLLDAEGGAGILLRAAVGRRRHTPYVSYVEDGARM